MIELEFELSRMYMKQPFGKMDPKCLHKRFVAFCSFFGGSLTVCESSRQQKRGGRQQKSQVDNRKRGVDNRKALELTKRIIS